MKIILGSTNISKKNSIILALNELGMTDYEITCIKTNSEVSSKPINEETLIGASNRNKNLLNYCNKNNIPFDLLISIEGGYEEVINNYFIVTYTSIIDTDRNEYIGKSQGLQISKKMFEWVKSGNSLNKVIESLEGIDSNKKEHGISGYLTNSYYKRSIFDSSAVISALISMNNYNNNYQKLNNKLQIKESKNYEK